MRRHRWVTRTLDISGVVPNLELDVQRGAQCH